MLFVDTIVQDYGKLFPIDVRQEDFAKKTQWNFDTTNKVKIQSKWLAQNTRGMNTFDMQKAQTERPNLIVLDDIDVLKSVQSISIINKNENKILWEIFGALDPTNHKIAFLWNTILEDWVVPRLRNRFSDDSSWDVFRQPLFDDRWHNIRPEVFDEDVIKEAKSFGKISFEQNYLLIPASNWSWIFIRKYFDYFLDSHFEDPLSFLKKQDVKRWIFIDPATSSSDKSDDAVCIILWEHRISKQYYLLDWYSGTSAPSTTISSIISMYNKAVMWWYKIEFISCEDVSINKGQTQFIKDLRKALVEHQINIPFYTFDPKWYGDKVIRIQTSLEPVMSQLGMKFNRNIWWDFLNKLEKQLLDFPNGDHEDHPDCVSQWIIVFRKWVSSWTTKQWPPQRRNPITNQVNQQSNNLRRNPLTWWRQ
jgi:predicted phage terminase large subunit-like protein